MYDHDKDELILLLLLLANSELNKTGRLFPHRGGSRRVAKFLQESTLIAFDFIWKV